MVRRLPIKTKFQAIKAAIELDLALCQAESHGDMEDIFIEFAKALDLDMEQVRSLQEYLVEYALKD